MQTESCIGEGLGFLFLFFLFFLLLFFVCFFFLKKIFGYLKIKKKAIIIIRIRK